MSEAASKALQANIICRDYPILSVEEYLEVIMFLSKCEQTIEDYSPTNGTPIPRLWYRGQQRTWSLLPSLFRAENVPADAYSRNHAREDFRYQHFRAKCNQYIIPIVVDRVESATSGRAFAKERFRRIMTE